MLANGRNATRTRKRQSDFSVASWPTRTSPIHPSIRDVEERSRWQLASIASPTDRQDRQTAGPSVQPAGQRDNGGGTGPPEGPRRRRGCSRSGASRGPRRPRGFAWCRAFSHLFLRSLAIPRPPVPFCTTQYHAGTPAPFLFSHPDIYCSLFGTRV